MENLQITELSLNELILIEGGKKDFWGVVGSFLTGVEVGEAIGDFIKGYM